MKNIIIYVLIDPRNNQVRYIGKTNGKLSKRLKGHLYRAKTGNNCPVYTWIRKLLSLKLAPVISVQEYCKESDWEEREKYWISFYRNKYTNIVNVSDGGITPLTNKELAGKAYTSRGFKEVHQYDLDGNYINSFKNVNQASLSLNISRQGIELCAKGKACSSGGFFWSYSKAENISVPKKNFNPTSFKKGHTPVNKGKKLSLETRRKQGLKKMRKLIHLETGKIYNSVKEAAEKNNIPYGTLTFQLFNNSKNLKFKYYE